LASHLSREMSRGWSCQIHISEVYPVPSLSFGAQTNALSSNRTPCSVLPSRSQPPWGSRYPIGMTYRSTFILSLFGNPLRSCAWLACQHDTPCWQLGDPAFHFASGKVSPCRASEFYDGGCRTRVMLQNTRPIHHVLQLPRPKAGRTLLHSVGCGYYLQCQWGMSRSRAEGLP
jgi:hypothetical protein